MQKAAGVRYLVIACMFTFATGFEGNAVLLLKDI